MTADELIKWLLYFFIYSVLGYLFESIFCTVNAWRKGDEIEFKNRGFLFGPWIPIWGSGAVASLFLTGIFDLPWWGDFLLIVIIGSLIEYFTSLVMERMFHVRWWDYSKNKHNPNLDGRISLKTSLGFGVGGLFVKYCLHPDITAFVDSIPQIWRAVLVLLLTVIFVIDIVMTNIATSTVKNALDGGHVDLTSEIKRYVRNYYRKTTRENRRRARLALKHMKKLQKETVKKLRSARRAARQKFSREIATNNLEDAKNRKKK